jgi:hypothetical protein
MSKEPLSVAQKRRALSAYESLSLRLRHEVPSLRLWNVFQVNILAFFGAAVIRTMSYHSITGAW